MVQVYRHLTTDKLEVRHELRSARDPSKEITIAELAKLNVETVELDKELALLYDEVRKSENLTKTGG